MKGCLYIRELAEESDWLMSVLMPTANFVNRRVHFYEKLKPKRVTFFLQQVSGICSSGSGCFKSWKQGNVPRDPEVVYGRANQEDSKTSSGMVHSRDVVLVL